MQRGWQDFTGYSESGQGEYYENLAVEFARSIESMERATSQRRPPANKRNIDSSDKDIELKDVVSDSSSPSILSEALQEVWAPENSRATLLAAADKPDVLVWTFARLWDAFSNVIANGTNSDTPNPNSSYSKFLNSTHTSQGINGTGDALVGAGAVAVLVGLAQRIYQLYRMRELNTPQYTIRRLDEMRNKYKERFKLDEDDVKAYHYTPDDILNVMNEIIKRESFNYPTSQSDGPLPEDYEKYFETSQFIKNFNKFTETKPIQFLGDVWEYLDVQSLWFWVIWFPAYFIAGAALAAAMPFVLIVTFSIGFLHLLQKFTTFIHKKIEGIDDAEVEKAKAEVQLVLNKLKIQLVMEEDHKMFMDMMKKKHDADIGVYDLCVVASDETTFLDDIENDETSGFSHRLNNYLDGSFKPIESLAEAELPDENVKTGKLYLQKVEVKNKNGDLESCIAYVVKNPKGKIVSGVIPHSEINPPKKFTHRNLNLIKNQILEYTARKDHTLDLNKFDLAKELNNLNQNDLPRAKSSGFEIDTNNREIISLKMISNPNQEDPNQQDKSAPCEHLYSHPDRILSSDLAKHLLGSEEERKARLIVSTAHKAVTGFIFTSFMLWLAVSLAGIFPAAVLATNVLSNGIITNSIAMGIGSLFGINTYCKVKAEQADYKMKVYEKLTEVVSPGVTRLDKFTELEKKVEQSKARVVELREEITKLQLQKNNNKELNEDEKSKLVPELDISKIDVYNHYYFEKQKDKPSLKTMFKKGLNRFYQAISGGQSGILVLRLVGLAGGIAAGILTGTIVPFLICAGVAALVMGGLQLAKYQLNRNQEHRENFVNNLKERTDYLAIEEQKLAVVINTLEENKKAVQVSLEPELKPKKPRKIAHLVEKKMENVPAENHGAAVTEVKKEQAKNDRLPEKVYSSSHWVFYKNNNENDQIPKKDCSEIENSRDLIPLFS